MNKEEKFWSNCISEQRKQMYEETNYVINRKIITNENKKAGK